MGPCRPDHSQFSIRVNFARHNPWKRGGCRAIISRLKIGATPLHSSMQTGQQIIGICHDTLSVSSKPEMAALLRSNNNKGRGLEHLLQIQGIPSPREGPRREFWGFLAVLANRILAHKEIPCYSDFRSNYARYTLSPPMTFPRIPSCPSGTHRRCPAIRALRLPRCLSRLIQ
jgi:hypothetical protein